MAARTPIAELDARFSAPGVAATDWEEGRAHLETAELYWFTTVRRDGRPHVTPLIAVSHDGAMYMCTGPDERKAKNLRENKRCALTTGCDKLNEGLDLVVEGDANRVTDEAELQGVARAYLAKYGDDWTFEVRDGAFSHQDGGVALVFRIEPSKILAFRKGEFSQTRWRF
jgi:general stress protein 26